ncbi:MAG: hypothetical protein NTZ04_01290 [Chloroflexi bacterium]|nr:hypothetical protein [Chloroflexota bacterium]
MTTKFDVGAGSIHTAGEMPANTWIIFKDFPRAVVMMGVSVYNGHLFHSEVASQLMDGYSGAVEVASATEEIAAGMMIAVSGEDKGIIYLIAPYPDGC